MQNPTRIKYTEYLDNQAQINNVPKATEIFSVAPSIQQRLESRIQQSSDFLKLINIIPVDELTGAKLGLGTNGPIASRTNTDNAERTTRDASNLTGAGYLCVQTNYDTHIGYNKLDMWAKFPDFQLRLARAIQRQCALDRIMIGLNGVSIAETTDRTANPLLQDVNKGWIQYIRENAPERVMSGGAAPGEIRVGPGGDYETLDGLVYDAQHSLLDEWHVEAGDLVAIVGAKLMHDKLFPLVDKQDAPTEMLAADIVRSQKRVGGLPGAKLPYMPADTVLITSYSNLSIYYQDGARRRAVIENPRRNRIETFESSNDAFLIEDLGKACVVQNIKMI